MAELMRMNQGLLAAVGVSHPAIEDVVATATKLRRGGGRETTFASKLTGAGGGGCMVALSKEPQRVSEQIEIAGGMPMISKLLSKGVRVL